MTEKPKKPTQKPAKPPVGAKAAPKQHPAHRAASPVPVAPVPASVPAKGLAVLSLASGLIGAAVFGLVRRGR